MEPILIVFTTWVIGQVIIILWKRRQLMRLLRSATPEQIEDYKEFRRMLFGS